MKISVKTEDNVDLSASVLKARDPRGVVIINPSTATKTDFYLPFAEYLTQNGLHVVLWNYRGFCDSRNKPLAKTTYRYSDIGRYDIPAVIRTIKHTFEDLPLYCVGHSAGGQQLGFSDCHKHLTALLAVGVSSGYFGHMPLSYRLKALFFFKLFAPLTSLLFNYVPARKISAMESLPAAFTKEWGSWCNEKDWFFSDRFAGRTVPAQLFKDFDLPTYVISASDDEICTEQNITHFWKHVCSKKPVRFIRYNVKEQASGSIGHLGYFKRRNREVWDDLLILINQHSNATKATRDT